MNLHALRLFDVIAATGSVTRASDILNISQPAITAQIKKLEKDISLPLFRAHGRGIALTDEGKQLASYTKRLFAVEQQIEQFLHDFHHGTTGYVRLCATYLPAHFLLPVWIATFKHHFEQVDIAMQPTTSSEALQQLLQIEVDLAIYGGAASQQPDGIQIEQLLEDELWFVVSPKHRYANERVSLTHMMQVPFVLRSDDSATRTRLLALCHTALIPPPRIPLQFDNVQANIQAVIAGYGASFVSAIAVRGYVERGELSRVYVDDVQLHDTISIWTRKQEPLSPAATNFVQWIRMSPSLSRPS